MEGHLFKKGEWVWSQRYFKLNGEDLCSFSPDRQRCVSRHTKHSVRERIAAAKDILERGRDFDLRFSPFPLLSREFIHLLRALPHKMSLVRIVTERQILPVSQNFPG